MLQNQNAMARQSTKAPAERRPCDKMMKNDEEKYKGARKEEAMKRTNEKSKWWVDVEEDIWKVD